jgi:hypothetical protein
MEGSSTTRAVFVSGLMIGVAVALGSVMVLRDKHEPPAAAEAAAPAAKAMPVRSDVMGAGPAPELAKADAASCGTQLLMTRADGESSASLEPAPAKALPGQVARLLLQGKEAVASGRQRDAEASFMNACRTASVDTGADAGVEMADAKYQLARLYSQEAANAQGAAREQMLAQARSLFTASLQTYTARYGPKHEKTRFATEALARVGGPAPQKLAKAEPAKVEPAKPAPAKIAPPRPEPAKPPVVAARKPEAASVVQAPPMAPAPKPAAQQPAPATRTARAAQEQPSFDCRRARSTSEKSICGDNDRARQDRELGKVYARAKSKSPDPRAFQRESDAEWAQRESSCHDKECLQRWYAHRREQLSAATGSAYRSPEQQEVPTSSAAEPVAEASGDAGVTR